MKSVPQFAAEGEQRFMLQFALAFVVFVSSACGMVMEIVAGRLIGT